MDWKSVGSACADHAAGEGLHEVAGPWEDERRQNMKTNKRGIKLLQDPSLNKSTAFTEAEKQALGLVGLLPDVTETEDLQLSRLPVV